MPSVCKVSANQDGLSVTGYRGDRAVLLALNLEQQRTPHFAGFAIQRTEPGGNAKFLLNSLSFQPITAPTSPGTTAPVATPSDQAPFQKFRWIDFPSHPVPGTYTYDITAKYFGNGGLTDGPTVSVGLDLLPQQPDFAHFQFGFTRCYVSSQAYARDFHNAPIAPVPPTADFDTAQFLAQYQFLGFHARELVFGLLEECINDPEVTLDVFAFDLNEPDFIRGLQQLGNRLRIFMDDSAEHMPTGLEAGVKTLLEQSAGQDNVHTGHFTRFAHDKIMIKKTNGTPTTVLTGSANFSVRGLYVQANNVLRFDDEQVAGLYEQVFEQVFTDMHGFKGSQLSKQWFPISGDGLPNAQVSFAPHSEATLSLTPLTDAIKAAKSSVLYAIMVLAGGGDALKAIQDCVTNKDIFSFGVTQTVGGSLGVVPPGATNPLPVPFAALDKDVPAPFTAEITGGQGQVIHDKFVVVDFNGDSPKVFTGSSNLAAGGEENNGDNLLAITDPTVATAFGIEAIQLVDHFKFRALVSKATNEQPLMLKGDSANWWAPYYDPADPKCRERIVFCQ
jgi:hypothetical protein